MCVCAVKMLDPSRTNSIGRKGILKTSNKQQGTSCQGTSRYIISILPPISMILLVNIFEWIAHKFAELKLKRERERERERP